MASRRHTRVEVGSHIGLTGGSQLKSANINSEFSLLCGTEETPSEKLARTMKVISKEKFVLKGVKCTYESEEQGI